MASAASRAGATRGRAAAAAAFLGLLAGGALAFSRAHLVTGPGREWYGVLGLPSVPTVAAAVALAGLIAFALRGAPHLASPFAGLLVAALPLVPALTGHFPLLLAPQGPFLLLIFLGLAAVALARGPFFQPRPPFRLPVAGQFAVPFLAYLALSWWLPGPAGPQGDEPHYLVMAQSLLSDGDLDLADDFRGREYSSFYSGDLRAHASPHSPRGRLYSIHAPGLPILIAPAYALAGYGGAQALMAALAAATACLVYRLAHHVLASAGLATLAWAAAAFMPPSAFYAVALYPETPAALAVALFALVPYSGPRTRGAAIAAAALLPWLHPKLLPLAGVGTLLALLRATGRRERVIALAVPLASLGLLLAYFDTTYGTATLGAAYGPGLASDLSPLSIPRGLLALFADRQFGLLLHAPFWALAFVGVVALARERPLALAPLLLLGASTAAVGAAFSMWWGGACPPARFLVPTLPVLAVRAARGARERRDLTALLAGASVAVVLLAAWAPRALHNRPDGQSALLRLLAPALDLDQYLPSFVIGDLLPALPLGIVIGGGPLVRDRPPAHRPGHDGSGRAAARLALGADPPRGSGGPRPSSGLGRGPDLESPRQRLPTRPRDPHSPSRATLGARARHLSCVGPIRAAPGRYVVHLRGRATGVARTRVEMRSDDFALAAGDWAPGTEEMRLPMLLPVGARRLALVVAGLGTTIDGAALEPESVLDRGQRPRLPWPRNPGAESYRVGAGIVRATPIDPAEPEEGGFRLGAGPGRFAVEAPCGALVEVSIRPPAGLLEWGGRSVPVERAETSLPARDGLAMGATCVVPVRLHAAGALVAFRDAALP